tara:strand:- start:1379 stop:1657 length:279 start_codon:yes stop_codon:yes gene_type:complete
MFAKCRDDYLKLRKQAVKNGMPDWALLHADMHANRGIFARSRATGRAYQAGMNRAKAEMLEAVELLRAFMQSEGRLRRYKTPLLNELLEAKK